ncbi:Very-long-chain (3R)-3-hydroxyacyl-CoA dehydratase 4 [Labeo rohita]|uniref:Very-long-chain (3R)-3-hydroxyacyl-CoA dehydratase n=2 Tax=Labeo rohita TaxID=84645 RepID=A0ABQ8MKJ5_LABRO|nr:very-long-chain (3R)-3-hydroxyacyl-CoA dehydratase 4 isoform X3 [Labeo rohita]XP_050972016.1 very-long-chain (3R)-3-hydroxyacyl-CoA dehydratase 4 isoform X3 [Labeo rohita]KAI2662877.1 Very-long-chain (3R)-3-hydroxyacyl-CoA dehydratase 4 [Labeo rohita]
MTARFLSFGEDAQAGTFYFVGVMMSACQLLSLLELFHIADGFEECRLFPRFMQIMQRNVLLLLLISLEEFQSKPIVCVQFYLWNILGLLRYPHELFCLIGTPYFKMLWVHQTLSIPVYLLSAVTEGISISHMLLYLSESEGMDSVQLKVPASKYINSPYILMGWLLLLVLGSSLTLILLLKERKENLESWDKKLKTD